MINKNYRVPDIGLAVPEMRSTDARRIRPGDRVRALRGRQGGQGETGIVLRRRAWGRAAVRWTTLDVTTVPTRHLTKIKSGRGRS